jgi:hypothetical protein
MSPDAVQEYLVRTIRAATVIAATLRAFREATYCAARDDRSRRKMVGKLAGRYRHGHGHLRGSENPDRSTGPELNH